MQRTDSDKNVWSLECVRPRLFASHIAAIVCALSLCWALVTRATAGDEPKVADLLATYAARTPLPTWLGKLNAKITYKITYVYVPPDEELAGMAERIKGRPDHPERLDFEMYNRRRAGTSDSLVRVVVFSDTGAWRISETTNAGFELDVGKTGRVKWKAAPGLQLAVGDKDASGPTLAPVGHYWDDSLEILNTVFLSSAAGLPFAQGETPNTLVQSFRDSPWRNSPYIGRANLSRNESAGALVVDRVEGVKPATRTSVKLFDFGPWTTSPSLGVYPISFLYYFDDKPHRRIEISDIVFLSNDESAILCQVPVIGKFDPLRNKVFTAKEYLGPVSEQPAESFAAPVSSGVGDKVVVVDQIDENESRSVSLSGKILGVVALASLILLVYLKIKDRK